MAFAGATWNAQPYTLSLPHINSVGQTTEGSLVLPLAHDSSCSVTVSINTAGDELLTKSGQTLVTYYRLTGPALSNPDPDFITSGDFLARTYLIPGTGPLDSLTLGVRGVAPLATAIDAGDYTANVTLTVTW